MGHEPEIIVNKSLSSLLKTLKNINSGNDIYSFMSDAYSIIEKSFTKHKDDLEASMIACAQGCGTCCKLNVTILPLESIAIKMFIEKSWNEAEKEDHYKRLKDFYIRCDGLEDEDRIIAGIPCVFLSEAGDCMIYPVRPFICRSISSNSVDSCKDSFSSLVFDEEEPVLMNIFQKQFMEYAFRYISNEMDENGFDSRSVGLLISLNYFTNSQKSIDSFIRKEKINYF